jgi:hypothetical protein
MINENKLSLAARLMLKSLEFDTNDNYKAFSGLALINIIAHLEMRYKKNIKIASKKDAKDYYIHSKHFLDKAYFYSLNTEEATNTVKSNYT